MLAQGRGVSGLRRRFDLFVTEVGRDFKVLALKGVACNTRVVQSQSRGDECLLEIAACVECRGFAMQTRVVQRQS